MRSPVSTWFSRRLARMSIAAFLAVLMVGGVAFASGALLHPPKAHAGDPPLINIPSEYRPLAKGITNCVLQAALGIPIIYIGAAPAAFIEGGVYLARAARIALLVNDAIQTELKIEQIVSLARIIDALSKVDSSLIGTVTAGNCLGIIAFNLNNAITNKIWGDSDPVGAASALAADANALCSNVPGSTVDTTTLLCQNPDGSYVQPDGTAVGSTPCALTPGTAVDSASGMCSDFGGPNGTDAPHYFGPYGDTYGQCQTGYPIGDGATCTDGNGNLYAPDGTLLNPPNQPLGDCTNYLLGNGSADPCDYTPLETSFTPPPTPTDTPTPAPDTYVGTFCTNSVVYRLSNGVAVQRFVYVTTRTNNNPGGISYFLDYDAQSGYGGSWHSSLPSVSSCTSFSNRTPTNYSDPGYPAP